MDDSLLGTQVVEFDQMSHCYCLTINVLELERLESDGVSVISCRVLSFAV